MKYFFLADSWTTGRVWEFGGLWNEQARRRRPYLQKQSLCIQEDEEVLCLYEVEDAILMVEVVPKSVTPTDTDQTTIGQVVLKRLLSAEQTIERLCQEQTILNLSFQAATPADDPSAGSDTTTTAQTSAPTMTTAQRL